MNRKTWLTLTLACLIAASAGLAEAGTGSARSPVGAWAVVYDDDTSPTGDNNTLQAFHSGGTTDGAAWSDSKTNTVGSWGKTGNRYLTTFYVMVPAADGYVKVRQELWMVDKNEMRGREEGWWVPGRDPRAAPVALLWTGDLTFYRLPVEPKEAP